LISTGHQLFLGLDQLQISKLRQCKTLGAMLQRQSANAGSSIGVVPQFINRLTKQIFTNLTSLYFDNGTSAEQNNMLAHV
jgi:site-specific recombinase